MPDGVTDIPPPPQPNPNMNTIWRFDKDLNNWVGEERPRIPSETPETDLHTLKSQVITQTHALLALTLETPMEFNNKLYSVTLEKQNLLSAQLGLFMLNSQTNIPIADIPMQLTWNTTGEECIPWEFEDLLTLANAIAMHVEPFVKAQRHAEVIIKSAETAEAINAAMEEYKATLGV
jgi:hypothetical protein